MASPQYGIQVQTVDSCKICQSEHRAAIEDAIVCGRRKLPGPDGRIPTQKWFAETAERLWGMKINSHNIWAHGKKHFREGDPAELEEAKRDAATELRALVESGELRKVSPEEYAEAVIALAYEKLMREPEKVSVRDAISAIDSLTRRRHNEAQDKMLEMLVSSTGSAVRTIGPARPPVIEVEAEIVEGAEVDS